MGLVLSGIAWPASATTYTYTAANYAITVPFTPPCTAGTCTNYTTAMSLTGSFTTATPLAADLANSNIAGLVTSFSFNDGLNTYSSGDPNTRILAFDASTDSSGVPNASMFIVLAKWITGSTPHTGVDRFSQFDIDFNVDSLNNLPCTTVGTQSGVADTCISAPGSDTNTSEAFNSAAGVWMVSAGGGPSPTTVNLGTSFNPSVLGQTVTFTATVNGSSPTGTVQFKDGSANLGSAVTLAGGVATLSTAALGVGTHAITAVYGGDTNNAGSASLAVNQVVNAAIVGSAANTPIPTLSEWALVLLIALVLAIGALGLRDRVRR